MDRRCRIGSRTWERWGFSSLPSSTPLPFHCLFRVALTCCCCGWWRTVEIPGCLPRSPSPAAWWADIPPGASGAKGAKRLCTATCRRVFLAESSDGWSVTASSPCFFPPCFLRRFHCCHLCLRLARWAYRAGAFWSSMARLEPCDTPSLPGSALSMDVTPSAFGQGRSRSGRLR